MGVSAGNYHPFRAKGVILLAHINQNYQKLPGSDLFSEVARRICAYSEAHPDREIIRLSIGDVTLPLAPAGPSSASRP